MKLKRLKFSSLVILLILFSLGQAHAQGIVPQKETIKHEKKDRQCYVVHVDPEPDVLKKAWRDYLKENYDFKLRGFGLFGIRDMLSAEEVTIESVSPKALDFYTFITEDENGSVMKVFAAFGYDIYINEQDYAKEDAAIRKMLVDFLKEYLPSYHKKKLAETEKRIKSLTKEKKKLSRGIEKSQKEIKKLKKEVENLTEEMEENTGKLKDTEIKLKNRKAKLERTKTKLDQL